MGASCLALQDPAVLGSVLAFYRLMAAWMLRLACPSTAGIVGALPELPLPTAVPFEFASLPVRSIAASACALWDSRR